MKLLTFDEHRIANRGHVQFKQNKNISYTVELNTTKKF